MIHGIGLPKFYIYDSTGVTLQKTITLSLAVMRSDPIIDRVDIRNTTPYTRTKLRENLGYYYSETLSVGVGDYYSTLLQYQADQANSNKRDDLYKLKQVIDYADAGYVIKYTPHADLEDVWGFSPFQVDVFCDDLGQIANIKSGSISVTVEGVALRSSAFMWNEFSFTELSGVSNANQCMQFNGTTQYATCTEFDIGTTHTIEFWADLTTPGGIFYITYGSTGGASYLVFSSTNLVYVAQGTTGGVMTVGSVSAGTKHHYVVRRAGTAIDVFRDGVFLATGSTISANSSFKIQQMFQFGGGDFYAGKFGLFRIYQSYLSSAQIALQYNSGYGNWPLDVSAYQIVEFNGTGGTSTTETDQSGNGRTLTLFNTPTRTTW